MFPFYFFGPQAIESPGWWVTFSSASQAEGTSLASGPLVGWPFSQAQAGRSTTSPLPQPPGPSPCPSAAARPFSGAQPRTGLDAGFQASDPVSAQGSANARLCHLCQQPGVGVRRGRACRSRSEPLAAAALPLCSPSASWPSPVLGTRRTWALGGRGCPGSSRFRLQSGKDQGGPTSPSQSPLLPGPSPWLDVFSLRLHQNKLGSFSSLVFLTLLPLFKSSSLLLSTFPLFLFLSTPLFSVPFSKKSRQARSTFTFTSPSPLCCVSLNHKAHNGFIYIPGHELVQRRC